MASAVARMLASPVFWQVWEYARRNVVEIGNARLGTVCVEPHSGLNLSHQLLSPREQASTKTRGWLVRQDAPLPRYAIIQLPVLSSLSRVVVMPFVTKQQGNVVVLPPGKLRVQVTQEPAVRKDDENGLTVKTGLRWQTVAVITSLQQSQEFVVDLDKKNISARCVRLCMDEGPKNTKEDVWMTGIARVRVFGSPALTAESLVSLQSLDLQSVVGFMTKIKQGMEAELQKPQNNRYPVKPRL